MKKSTLIICVIVGVLMMFFGGYILSSEGDSYVWDGGDDWETETLQECEMSQVKAIQITTQGMNVRLYEGWDKTISVDVSTHALDRVSCTLGSDGVLTVEETASGRGGEIDLWIPKGCIGTLTASTQSGDIDASSVRGDSMDYTLTTVSGQLSSYGSRLKSLTASTASGDISLYDTEVYGPMAVSTASGNMYIDGLEGQDCRVTSASGDVDLHASQGTALTAETASGDVELEEADFPALTVTTASGDVDLRLPGTPEDYTVTLSTGTGHVDGIRERTGGTRTLSVTTTSGDIEAGFYTGSAPDYDDDDDDNDFYDD